jgi:hypothetical protein
MKTSNKNNNNKIKLRSTKTKLKSVANRYKNVKINTIDKQLSKIVLGASNTYQHLAKSEYAKSLVFPECTHGARVPGKGDATIPIRRKFTYNLITNALGCAGIVWFPPCLSDNTSNLSNFYVNTGATYDGQAVIGATGPVAISTPQNITVGSVGQYRLVSASMHIIPQSSVLNQAGTIHGTMLKTPLQGPTGVGSVYAANQGITLLPNFQNSLYYNAASVSSMEGLRQIWLPNDECFLEFANVNFNIAILENSDIQCNALVADIVGTAANAPFRVDLYWNFEITAPSTSILLGMESICDEDTVAASVWRSILIKHADDITIASKTLGETVAAKYSEVPPSYDLNTKLKNYVNKFGKPTQNFM